MKCASFIVRGVVAAAMLALVPNEAAAQTVSPGPYYATPSWNQKLQCDTPATCPRFVVLSNWNNEAVLDRETGLVWERSPLAPCLAGGPFGCTHPDSGRRIWVFAIDRCQKLNAGGRMGWRLPRVEELATLMDRSATSTPVLFPGHPFVGVQADFYWSTTPNVDFPVEMMGVDFFGDKFVTDVGAKTNENFVWCVRGASSDPS